jgi:hypothetical protein
MLNTNVPELPNPGISGTSSTVVALDELLFTKTYSGILPKP